MPRLHCRLQLQLGFDPWHRNFHVPWVQPERKEEGRRKEGREGEREGGRGELLFVGCLPKPTHCPMSALSLESNVLSISNLTPQLHLRFPLLPTHHPLNCSSLWGLQAPSLFPPFILASPALPARPQMDAWPVTHGTWLMIS